MALAVPNGLDDSFRGSGSATGSRSSTRPLFMNRLPLVWWEVTGIERGYHVHGRRRN